MQSIAKVTPTDELRRMLDERGVEYIESEDSTTIFFDAEGNKYTYYVNPESGWAQLYDYHITPAQAVAATMGEKDAVPVTKYQMLHDRYREASMDAERWERVAHDHESLCKSLRETNADLRRMLKERDAATVGYRAELSKRLRDVRGLHAFAELFGFSWADETDWTWHDVACAMADAVDAATVGAGTCEWEPIDGARDFAGPAWRCSACHYEVSEFEHDTYMYCPKCGRRVIERGGA